MADMYQVPTISTGDLLRAGISAGTDLGRAAEQYMKKGELVPDQLILDMMKERLTASDCSNGYLLDGFPRTVAQADNLRDIGAAIRVVLFFELDDDIILARLGGRWIHPASGRVYHETNRPPRRPGLDDETGEPLAQRPDDSRETVSRRLEVYHQQTRPLISYYRQHAEQGELIWITIDCSQDAATVQQNITDALREHGFMAADSDCS